MCRIAYAGLSDPGRVRQRNEDRWLADPDWGLFVVSDGMGGECAGELAAQIVIETLPPLLRQALTDIADLSDPRIGEQVQGVLTDLSRHVLRESQGHPGLDGMGATVVLALVREHQALISHLGDSRAYVFRDGHLEQVTHDHSLLQVLLDCGEITSGEVAEHPARNQLTRYVGMNGEPLPEAKVLELLPGDRLLLCSDGLTGMLTNDEVCSILAEQGSPATACDCLVAAANAAGGRDNITTVIVAAADDEVHDPNSAINSRTSLSISDSEPT